MLVFILTVGMFSLVGCGDKTAKSNVSDADGAYFSNNEEKKQFTEIITASGETIGIIDNNKEIERFVKQLDIESWNDMEQWKYADNAPKPRDVGCQIVKFMLSRDSNKIILLI